MEKEELSVSGEREQFEKWLGTETCEVHIDESANKNAWYGWQAAAALYREKWVSVEERLPEQAGRVLVLRSNDHTKIDMGWYSGTTVWERGFYRDGEQDTNVTHWMPLPDPPEAK